MNEDQILSEYMDNELPPEVAKQVEARFKLDSAFQARYQALLSLRKIIQAPILDAVLLTDMQAHVWQQVQRRLGGHQRPFQHWLSLAMEAMHRRIALPMPALAAMLVVVLALGIFAIGRGGQNNGQIAAANQSSQIATPVSVDGNQSMISLPSTLGSMPLASKSLNAAGFKLDSATGAFAGGRGMEVTIQVQNLRQLLTLLENNQDINEVTIQLPHLQTLHPLGETSLLRASDLGVSRAMPSGAQAGKP